MKFLTAVHTDVGIRKKTNQDSALVMQAECEIGNILLTVICDGMGGLSKGEVASASVINAFVEWFENTLPQILTEGVSENAVFQSWENTVVQMNEKIADYGERSGISLGTTVVALLIVGEDYYIMNIGDSRAYCIRDAVYQMTKDQTYVQREMDEGRMTYEEALKSPQRNVLLQCVGASGYIEPDYYSGKVVSKQVYMLCSDGFRHLITEEELYEYLNPHVLVDEESMKERAKYLTDLNKYRREMDNITVILVKVP